MSFSDDELSTNLPRSNVRCSDVSLKIAGVCEYFVTILAWKPPELTVNHLMPEQIWSPGESFVAMFTHILVRFIPMVVNHVFVQSKH